MCSRLRRDIRAGHHSTVPWPRPGMQSMSIKSLFTKYCNAQSVFQQCRARAGHSSPAVRDGAKRSKVLFTPHEVYFKERSEYQPWKDSTVSAPNTIIIFV